ncbi:DUF1302 domain-containing protein [Algiphilus aromaticivorans]|uniref:DUF1302 domain-containing protein n=1 Tax=Algiphilus aromaticivorans TaxID=382454 RepID=UPI0005C20E1D|nr:DUF1302 family protein [Algiphilus aromaticivorans]
MTRQWGIRAAGALAGLTAAAALPVASANTLYFGEHWQMEYLANLTYSAAMRGESASDRLLANINGDDGNRNFERESLVNNRAAVLGELQLERGRSGVFLRGSAFYDEAIMGGTPDHDAPERRNRDGATDRFSDAMKSRLGRRARVLDAYAYTSFFLGDTSFNIRAGEQVVSWGESLFFPNTSGAQSPADATSSNVPGTEVKEILLPVGQVHAQIGLGTRLGVSAYYQYERSFTELNPVGAYFSSTDVVGPGAEFLIVEGLPVVGDVQVPREADIKPGETGDWGVAMKYLFGLGTEVAIHYMEYDDKNPIGVVFNNPGPAQLIGGQSSYQVAYTDDIRLASISLSTDVFGTAVTSELSHRWDAATTVDAPALAGSPAPTPTRGDIWQANLGATYIFLPTAFWDQLIAVGEVSGVHVADVDPVEDGGEEYDELSNSRNAAAFQGQLIATWQQVLPGWDATVTFAHANAFEGKTSLTASLGSLTGQGDRRYRIGIAGTYLANFQIELAYNLFDGSPDVDRRALADRSFASFSARYSF